VLKDFHLAQKLDMTATRKFTKYNAGISITKPEYHNNKLSDVYHLDEKQKTSVVAALTWRLSTNESMLTVGGLYTIYPQTTMKAILLDDGAKALILFTLREMSTSALCCLDSAYNEVCGEFATYDGENQATHKYLLGHSYYSSYTLLLIGAGLGSAYAVGLFGKQAGGYGYDF
jgi:hypothetical protein